jgi:predicted kinase
MKKLIMLYGFAASGKTTLTKKYIDQNPLTFAIEIDKIIAMIGRWRDNEVDARKIVFEDTKCIVQNHLSAGYNVLIPYLLDDSSHAEIFEKVAQENEANFVEVYINLTKEDAVNRLIERGGWGEEGSRKLTEADRTLLENRFNHMTKMLETRKNIIPVSNVKNDIETTFKNLLSVINT